MVSFLVYFLIEESGERSRDFLTALSSIMAFMMWDRKPLWGPGPLLSMSVFSKILDLGQ